MKRESFEMLGKKTQQAVFHVQSQVVGSPIVFFVGIFFYSKQRIKQGKWTLRESESWE